MNTIELEKKVRHFTHVLVYEKGFVSSVDILLRLGYLSKANYELWRFGKIDYLEKVLTTNLSKLSLINKIMRKTASDLKLEKSWTGYNKYGKGVNKQLIFSKSRDYKIEEAYATHHVDKKRIAAIKENKTSV